MCVVHRDDVESAVPKVFTVVGTVVTVLAIVSAFVVLIGAAGSALFGRSDPGSATSDYLIPSIVTGGVVAAFALGAAIAARRLHQRYRFVYPALLVVAYALSAGWVLLELHDSTNTWSGPAPDVLALAAYAWFALSGAVLVAVVAGAGLVAHAHRHEPSNQIVSPTSPSPTSR